MRIAVVMSSLAGGGTERMRIHLIEEWVRLGIEVDLVVARFKGPLCKRVPPQVRVFELAPRHPLFFALRLRRYLRECRPSHILSAGNDINALTLFSLRKLEKSAPVVISFHAQLTTELKYARGMARLKLFAVIFLLKRYAHRVHAVIAVSKGVASDLKNHFPLFAGNIHAIYNPVLTSRMEVPLLTSESIRFIPAHTPWIVCVGRLTHQKGLDVLIDAFELIQEKTPAHLVLVGDGPQRQQLMAEISERNLADRIHIIGFQQNPLSWIRSADVLVMASRFEGLSNVLIEAMACGTEIVATDCPSGSAEILCDGQYGQLVPVEDSIALAHALEKSLSGSFHVGSEALLERAACFASEKSALEYLSILGER